MKKETRDLLLRKTTFISKNKSYNFL